MEDKLKALIKEMLDKGMSFAEITGIVSKIINEETVQRRKDKENETK